MVGVAQVFLVLAAFLITKRVLSGSTFGVFLARIVFAACNGLFVWLTLVFESSSKNSGAQDEMRNIRMGVVKRFFGILCLHLLLRINPPLIMSNVFTLMGILQSAAFYDYATQAQ